LTIEGWVYFKNSGANNNYDNLFYMSGSFQICRQMSSNKFYSFTGSNSGNESSGTLTDNAWHHVAVCRHSGTMYGYVGGVKKFQYADTTDLDITTSVDIGSNSGNSSWFLQELRVSNTARYPSGTTFTPHTSAHSSDSNTKLLIQSNPTNLHSGAYGTAQSDGKKYYYTDIKGSKPINDPRIGAHFGSQRMVFRSEQNLKDESAACSNQVVSFDGRENCRLVGSDRMVYDTFGGRYSYITEKETSFYEITGYFNACNVINVVQGSSRTFRIDIDGKNAYTAFNTHATVASPLVNRCVNAGSVVNIPIDGTNSNLSSDTTLGIHTLRMQWVSGTHYVQGVELIAQDTGSTARKSQINIPAQNVVSYGKKFSIGSDTLTDSVHTHYDPFNGWSGAKTPAQLGAVIDTGTSLGMENWKGGTSNYYRPWNGGRVVKWIASDGTIKTSVTMMPPNAQNLIGTDSNAVTNTEVQNGTNGETINFDQGSIDHSLSEVAKTFHVREFGNGAANGSHGGTWEDYTVTPLEDSTKPNAGYIMDDGLTGMFGTPYWSNYNNVDWGGSDFHYMTFIGTGFSVYGRNTGYSVAQNLSYGTHIIKMSMTASAAWYTTMIVDGITISNTAGASRISWQDFNFHQPKMPPIPEDACIIADYMLMADVVAVSGSTDVEQVCSKGIRLQSASRDVFYEKANGTPTLSAYNPSTYKLGYYQGNTGTLEGHAQLPYFGTHYFPRTRGSNYSTVDNGGSAGVSVSAIGSGTPKVLTSAAHTLGTYTGKIAKTNNSGDFASQGAEIAIPIHTSSHYQQFNTPYADELVGGDRNMEQTNLVVTADGKTWDELRDTSYIGNMIVNASTYAEDFGGWATIDYHHTRGTFADMNYFVRSEFAQAYDKWICLKEGTYRVSAYTTWDGSGGSALALWFGRKSVTGLGSETLEIYWAGTDNDMRLATRVFHFERGDWTLVRTSNNETDQYRRTMFQIEKA